MDLHRAIANARQLVPPVLPDLRRLVASVQCVRDRWPDVIAQPPEQDRERLALVLRDKVARDDWADTNLSFVLKAAWAVFDNDRIGRADLRRARRFLCDEVIVSTSANFLAGMLQAYLDGYSPRHKIMSELAGALERAQPRMEPSARRPLDAFPELLDAECGPQDLAVLLLTQSDPHAALVEAGMRNPQGGGFMAAVHAALTARVRDRLDQRAWIDWYLRWLRPRPPSDARTTGAECAIEALVHPWLTRDPEPELRSFLTESLIEFYGDPRIVQGVWSGINAQARGTILRWLAREDMRFFISVVDHNQNEQMWVQRREFWLQLFNEGVIREAWVAFSPEAYRYARQNLLRRDADHAESRFGYQAGRPGTNTSLLLMRIANKIFVDGCHSYRTHVFDADDRRAPTLYQKRYDCTGIMRSSDTRGKVRSARDNDWAKSHASIDAWQRWVRDMINADVPHVPSRRRTPEVRPPSGNRGPVRRRWQ